MRTKLLLCLMALSPCLRAQERGVTPATTPSRATARVAPTTRAVVIGISDYQDEGIPDLQFADRDAEAFAAWLRSPAGGNIPKEYILLHTNKAATNAQMILSLDWLIAESKAGDRAFIYFSGHGDVERVTKYNNGYLLGYDSPPAVYGAGAFAVNYLKDIIATLSENGVQVFLISDACRAGKLAGSNTNGAQVTSTRLAQQFANEIKILSCQPDEFSIEGKQWGGGRGCFSYHLENALYGFADKNTDAQINLMELDRYLQDNVSAEAAPESQIPMVLGPPKTVVTYVDAPTFTTRQEALKNHKTEFLAIDNKGFEEMVLATADARIQGIYRQFQAAIDSNQLMAPEGKSANDFFNILTADPEITQLHGILKRKFVVALMNEGQALLNEFIKSPQRYIDRSWILGLHYDHLPDYFNRASEILGPAHYVYNNLKAKEYYFLSKIYTPKNYPDKNFSWRNTESILALNKAIMYDSTAAYLFYELSLKYGAIDQREPLIQKAMTLAPNWIFPPQALAFYYFGEGKNQSKAREYFSQCIKSDSSYLTPYNFMSWSFEMEGQVDSSAFWRRTFVDRFLEKWSNDYSGITAYECNDIGNALWRLKEYKKAEKWLNIGLEISNGKLPSLYGNLDVVYVDLLEFEKAIETQKRKMENWRINANSLTSIGQTYFFFLGNWDEAKKNFDYVRDLKEEELQLDKVNFYFFSEHYDSALVLTKRMLANFPGNNQFRFFQALSHWNLKDTLNAKLLFSAIADSISIEFKENYIFRPDYVLKLISFFYLNREDALENEIKNLKADHPNDKWMHFNLSIFYAVTGQEALAIDQLNKAVELGWEPNPLPWMVGTLCDPLLDNIRTTPGYKTFVEQHFPYYLEVATSIPYAKGN
ncbi:MAG: caspase family protein [Saprospiraceae bacterium]|nr:caspase family protein [Saprospiraceae bacterium]